MRDFHYIFAGALLLIGLIFAISRRGKDRDWRAITFWFVWLVFLMLVLGSTVNLPPR